jgi:hypothetical protein
MNSHIMIYKTYKAKIQVISPDITGVRKEQYKDSSDPPEKLLLTPKHTSYLLRLQKRLTDVKATCVHVREIVRHE